MADTFRIRVPYTELDRGKIEKEHNRIYKEIRDRVDGCYEPNCWILKDNDPGTIYLNQNIIDGDKGRYVQMRRFLFLVTWKTIPDRRKLITYCGNYRCVNPAHARYKGFKPPYDRVKELIANEWLLESQAEKWYTS